MLIDLIARNAAQILLDRLEQDNFSKVSVGVLHFMPRKPCDQESLLLAIRPLLADKKAALYLFEDHDLIVTWHGTKSSVIDALRQALYKYFDISMTARIDRFFDSQVQAEELRFLCKHKIPVEVPAPAPVPAPSVSVPSEENASVRPTISLNFTDDERQAFRNVAPLRTARRVPEILIVEDQSFTANLMKSMLSQNYLCHTAPDALVAWRMYLEHAPDIVFLDIELPGMNGHDFAAHIRKLDPHAYIVMVTANNFREDVTRAKANGAKGFIIKPYSKQKIMESIDKFTQEYKTKRKIS